MIKLTGTFVITQQTLAGDAVQASAVMDTLFISSVRLDFSTGAIYATIRRGTGDPFTENYPSVDITVNPDGSFISTDGTWTGSLGSSVSVLVSQLQAQFDQFILASGLVQGSAI